MPTKIAWTDESWQPVVGCSKVSPGCDNCYAETMAKRCAGAEMVSYKPKPYKYCSVVEWNGQTFCDEKALEIPLHWKKPRKVFVCSMGDLFHESVPFEFIKEVIKIIAACPQHTFQILTKRPERMKQFFDKTKVTLIGPCPVPRKLGDEHKVKMTTLPLKNLWLGVTAENPKDGYPRIQTLKQIPAAVRFISIEPMLEGMRLTNDTLDKIDWVIVGGESGPGARPMHIDWARGVRDQCQAAGVPFFFKQWGEWYPEGIPVAVVPEKGRIFIDIGGNNCEHLRRDKITPEMKLRKMYRAGKKKAGNKLDGKVHEEYPNK